MVLLNTCLFVTGSFHSAECPQVLPMFQHGVRISFFLRLINIPVYSYDPIWGLRRPSKFMEVPGLCWEPRLRSNLPGKSHDVCIVAFHLHHSPLYLCLLGPQGRPDPLWVTCEGLGGPRNVLVLSLDLIRSQTCIISLYNRFSLFLGASGRVYYSIEIANMNEKDNHKGKYLLLSGKPGPSF